MTIPVLILTHEALNYFTVLLYRVVMFSQFSLLDKHNLSGFEWMVYEGEEQFKLAVP
jgi:hypothetical protein